MFYNNNNYTHITLPYNIKMHKLLLFFVLSLSHSLTNSHWQQQSKCSERILLRLILRHVHKALRNFAAYGFVRRENFFPYVMFTTTTTIPRGERKTIQAVVSSSSSFASFLLVHVLRFLCAFLPTYFLCCFFPLSHFAVDRVWHFIFMHIAIFEGRSIVNARRNFSLSSTP